MTNKELSLAKNLGSRSYFIYKILKINGKLSHLDFMIESGLSQPTIDTVLKKLLKNRIFTKHTVDNSRKLPYSVNEVTEWIV